MNLQFHSRTYIRFPSSSVTEATTSLTTKQIFLIVAGASPFLAKRSTRLFIVLFPTFARGTVPISGSRWLSSISRQFESTLALMGLRFRVSQSAIHFSANVRKVVVDVFG